MELARRVEGPLCSHYILAANPLAWSRSSIFAIAERWTSSGPSAKRRVRVSAYLKTTRAETGSEPNRNGTPQDSRPGPLILPGQGKKKNTANHGKHSLNPKKELNWWARKEPQCARAGSTVNESGEWAVFVPVVGDDPCAAAWGCTGSVGSS